MEVEPVALIGVYSDPEYACDYLNGDWVQPVTIFFECRVVGVNFDRICGRLWGHAASVPKISCCLCAPAASPKLTTLFVFQDRAFFR